MAYIKKEEETDQQGTETPQVSGAPAMTGVAPTQPAPAQPAQAEAPQASSGTFTNLQEYMTQNKPAAQQMAGQVTKGVEQQAQKIGQEAQQQQSDFMKRVAEQRTRLQQARQTAQEQITKAGQQEFQPQDIQATQQLATGQYQLPQQNLNIGAQQQQLKTLQKPVQQAQTAQGRQQLLKQTFGKGRDYTSGQQGLDELILAGSEQARRQIAEAPKAAVESAQSQLEQARRQALRETGGLEAERRQAQEAIASQIGGAETELQTALQERAGQGLLEKLQQGQLTQADIDRLGLQGGRLYGINAEDFLRQGTVSGVAGAEDLARAKALAALRGGEQGIIADESRVGSEDPYGIKGLQEAVSAAKQEYYGAMNPLLSAGSRLSQWDGRGGTITLEQARQNQLANTQRIYTDPTGESKQQLTAKEYYDKLGEKYGITPENEAERKAELLEELAGGYGILQKSTWDTWGDPRRQKMEEIRNLLNRGGLKSTSYFNSSGWGSAPAYDATKAINLLKQDAAKIRALRQQYGGQLTPSDVQTAQLAEPVAAEDGAIKTESPRIAALRKMLGKK